MKRVLIFISLFFLIIPNVYAQRGCCSHHQGVAGCSSSGRTICNDGTLSKTCTCTPTVTYIYGCTDKKAKNYDKNANKNDGSCEYYIYGCTDQEAKNYDADAEKDDGSCNYETNTKPAENKTISNNELKTSMIEEEPEEDEEGSILATITTLVVGGFIAVKKFKR